MNFQVNPLLLGYVKKTDQQLFFILEVLSDEPPLIINNYLILKALACLPQAFTEAEAIKIWNEKLGSCELSEGLWSLILENQLIVSTQQLGAKAINWAENNWKEAYSFHQATRDYPIQKMYLEEGFVADYRQMADYLSEETQPDRYYNIKSPLEQKPLNISCFSIENIDELIDQYANKTVIDFETLSLLFNFTFGEKTTKSRHYGGDLFMHNIRKTIPSGGSKHPTEAYYISFCPDGLAEGIYHYNVKNNTFDCLRIGNFYSECKNYTFDLFSRYKEPPSGMIILTSAVERAMFRYREPRSFRALIMDIGHAMMSFKNMCQFLKVDCFAYQKFNDAGFAKMLQLNSFAQPPLYVATLIQNATPVR